MQRINYLFVLISILILGSCGKKTADEIFEEQKGGVVLVLNKFYYEIKMPDGQCLYFTGMDQNGNMQGFTTNEAEARQNASMLNGTGFFISDDGKFITNRHVAITDVNVQQLQANLCQLVQSSLMQCGILARQIKSKYDMLEAQKFQYMEYDFYGNVVAGDQAMLSKIVAQQRELQRMYEEVVARARYLQNTDLSDIEVNPVCEIGISYDGEKVNSPDDFLKKNPCRILKIAQDEGTDLALLQLESKTTPNDAYVFKFAGEGNKEYFTGYADEGKVKIDQQLYMIGYNAGLALANTQKGISVQMTSGKVTQTPDGDRLLYSIPTVQGSSGSPVINEDGNVVAVNFAKLAGSDNFNFGIPLERIRNFLK